MSDATIPQRPPKLLQRMEELKIELPLFTPIFDRIFVYPLDKAQQPESTSGGIILPDQMRAKLGAQRGVLIMAGPRAVEQLWSHGVCIGDIVVTARLSPWERTYFSKDHRPHRVLVLRASEVVGSEDLLTAYNDGDLRMVMDEETGRVTVSDRERVDPPESDEGI